MIGWIRGWWQARCRSMDVEIFWPECKRVVERALPGASPETVRGAARSLFLLHVNVDPAWAPLSEDERIEAVLRLE